ncbi:MAG TPA: hypothetical protein DCQ41_04795 [Cryomorphaceae bacterium]|nr:hypothetical protein [Cryomorphaceae bacterium]|tara:strand:- start:1844 stop:2578 length:735 start_codon:yes stop_codon:yes gene_type:complete
MKLKMILALLGYTILAHGQVIRRSADLAKDEGLLTLRDSVRIAAYDNGPGTYEVHLHCWVHEDFVNVIDKRVMAEAALFSKKLDTLGKVRDSYPLDSLWESSARRKSNYYEVVLSGTLKSRHLERRSFPTYMLEQFFSEKRVGSIKENLENELKKSGWENKSFGDYDAWAFRDHQRNPGKPELQALFIFRGSMPYVLINKGALFEYPKLKLTEDRDYGTFYFFQRPNDRFLSEIDNIVLDYVQL